MFSALLFFDGAEFDFSEFHFGAFGLEADGAGEGFGVGGDVLKDAVDDDPGVAVIDKGLDDVPLAEGGFGSGGHFFGDDVGAADFGAGGIDGHF